jgi:hypothetical protein
MRGLWAIVPCVIFFASPARPQEPRKAPAESSVPRRAYDIDLISKWLDGPTPVEAPTDPADKAARAHLPKEAQDWDFIGAFKFRDRDKERAIAVYYVDSDSLAEKRSARGQLSVFSYPNFFSVRAVYENCAGTWVHKELYRAARVGFVRVKSRSSEAVVLELSPRFIVSIQLGENFEEKAKWLEEVNKPFEKRLTFEAGVPVLK